MKILATSDTHGRLGEIFGRWPSLLELDPDTIFIHAGDATNMGKQAELIKLSSQFDHLPFKRKIFVPGNHDLSFEKDETWARAFFSKDVDILIDQTIEIDGLKFHGDPWTPTFFDWAFMRDRGSEALKKKHDQIPTDADVVISHGPPIGVCDFNGSLSVGCELLLDRLAEVEPKLVICGHIHEGNGTVLVGDTLISNVALMNKRHEVTHKPKQFELIDGKFQLFDEGDFYE